MNLRDAQFEKNLVGLDLSSLFVLWFNEDERKCHNYYPSISKEDAW